MKQLTNRARQASHDFANPSAPGAAERQDPWLMLQDVAGNQAVLESLMGGGAAEDGGDTIADYFGIDAAGPGDGAGAHDSESAGIGDHALVQLWNHAATAAAAGGMPNAARHLRHYLSNTGAPLVLELDRALEDDHSYEMQHLDTIHDQLFVGLDGAAAAPLEAAQWDFELPRSTEHYFEAADSRDWYYAVGGHTTWYDGWYTYTPDGDGTGTLQMDINLYLFDRYNWDGEKAVELLDQTPLDGTALDVRVTDDQLGQLHRKGLAKEFEMYGDTHRAFTVKFFGDEDAALEEVS